MPLMTSMYTGVTGLKTSQIGIHTTAHNLANIYTEGYVRQQVSYADNNYSTIGNSEIGNWRLGLGVVASETRHIRDLLLDRAYREQAGRENYYSSQYEATEEVENILGELNQVAFQESLNQLWEAVSELKKEPDDSVKRAGLVMSADEFVTRVNAISDQLEAYQYNLNKEITDTVDRINELGDTIYAMNMKIFQVEAAGVESANDYRDVRDSALDELSQLVSITYSEDEQGRVSVRAEGQEFVMKGGVLHMELKPLDIDKNSDYLTPVWPHLENRAIFNTHVEISTAKGNDIGKLKGLIQARGGFAADYTYVPEEPQPPVQDDYLNPDGTPDVDAYNQASRDFYNNEYQDYLKEAQEYNFTIGASVIMKSQALLDKLVNNIVTTINDALCPNKEAIVTAGISLTIKAGTNYNMLSDEVKSMMGIVLLDSKGNLVNDETFTVAEDTAVMMLDKENSGNGYEGEKGVELFSREDTQGRYTEMTADDGTVYYAYNPYNTFGTVGKYSMGNIKINQTALDKSSSLPLWNSEGEANYKVMDEIISAWDKPTINLDPNNLTKKDFLDYYQAVVDLISNEGYLLKEVAENQQSVVNDLEDGRQSVMGVSSEEELTNLIKYQNAYNANSRYINAVAEMIDTLVNRVGVH